MGALEAIQGEEKESIDKGRPFRVADPEVLERPSRRLFTVEYKVKVLQEADRAREPGQIGALLRREGLYSSHLTSWRRQREKGVLLGLTPKERGRKPQPEDPRDKKIRELLREKASLEKRLKKAETIIEFQKKVSELLGISLENPQEEIA